MMQYSQKSFAEEETLTEEPEKEDEEGEQESDVQLNGKR